MSDLIREDAVAEAYRLGLTHGGAHLLEVAIAYGWIEASDHIASDVDVTMSADEQEILYDALQRVVALRIAPADLSALPEASEPLHGCHRPDCGVCAAPPAPEKRETATLVLGADPAANFREFLNSLEECQERAVSGWMLGNLGGLCQLLTSRLAEMDREAA